MATRKRQVLSGRILDLFTIHQQRWLFVANAYGGNVSSIEFYILLETSVDLQATVTSLAETMALERRLVAHGVKSLEKKGFLKSQTNPSDRRERQLTLLKKGTDVLKRHDKISRDTFKEFIKPLTKAELKQLLALFHNLADSFDTAPAKMRPTEEKRLAAGRRCFRAFGLIGPSFLESEYSSTDWNFLWILSRSPYGISPGELSKRLHVPKATTSHTLKRLLARKLISEKSSPNDGRSKLVSLSPKGLESVRELNDSFITKITPACKAYSVRELQSLISIFEKYVGLHPRSQFLRDTTDMRFEILEGVHAPPELRGFILESLVRTKRAALDDPLVLAPNATIYTLWKNDNLLGLAEVRDRDGKAATLVFFEFKSTAVEQSSAPALLKFVRADAKARGYSSLLLPAGNPAIRAIEQSKENQLSKSSTLKL